ncbi:hypothetical protein C1646_821728 [Rhizophagus diaphanus]|nr:hypothetical protein C1646_821728 [Rhizophagus diaphanus] [Rhizophagus sp. MUCL 43196]
MDLLKKFDELNNRLLTLLEENKELKRQNKSFQEENHVLKEKLNERDYENLQEENKKLKQHVLSLENQKNDQLQKYKNLQEENKSLNMRENQFKQHIQTLEKQQSEQFEIFSQNLEKALGKLRLDELHEDNVNNPQKDFILSSDELDEDNVDESLKYIKDSTAKEPTTQKVTIKKELISPINKSSFNKDNIRVVVGLDFGTTYSGFSYCHVTDSENIITNYQWFRETGNLKTNTVLQYDYEYNQVESWGLPALAKRPSRRENENRKRPIIRKPLLIIFANKIGELIKETIEARFQGIDFHKHVLLVLTVPTEYLEKDKAIMRECVHNAELIAKRCLNKLQFTTESEAAAIYCMQNVLKEHGLLTSGTTFMIVDCGGGTIDITIRKLIENNQLGKVTESTGDFCGSTFIDKEFVDFLRNKLGNSAIDLFITNHYGQFQYIIQKFCNNAKIPFTGDSEFFFELDIEEIAPVLLKYVNEETRNIMEGNDWVIEINYKDIKAMFDPIVDRIIKLINLQLSYAREKCSAMFLVGGFSESKYLQQRIKREFQNQINVISVPNQPMAAISCGATLYGLSLFNSENDNMKVTRCIITTRILKYTYGIKVRNYWMEGDPIERKLRNGHIDRFHCIAKRGTQVDTDEEFTTFFTPLSPMQTKVCFKIYYTTKDDAKYCDEPGMTLLGKFGVYLADSDESSKSGLFNKLFFAFIFGEMEIRFIARNEISGQNYKTFFEVIPSDSL